MIFVGYSETTKGYRLYNPVIYDVTISRDVNVFEDTKEVRLEINSKNKENG